MGRREEKDKGGGSHGPPPIPFSVLLPMISHHWEETGSLRFKCLPKKRDRGLSSRTMVSQEKKMKLHED